MMMDLKPENTAINQPYFDGLYNPFMVKLGMVYYCFTKIIYILYLLSPVPAIYIYIYIYTYTYIIYIHTYTYTHIHTIYIYIYTYILYMILLIIYNNIHNIILCIYLYIYIQLGLNCPIFFPIWAATGWDDVMSKKRFEEQETSRFSQR